MGPGSPWTASAAPPARGAWLWAADPAGLDDSGRRTWSCLEPSKWRLVKSFEAQKWGDSQWYQWFILRNSMNIQKWSSISPSEDHPSMDWSFLWKVLDAVEPTSMDLRPQWADPLVRRKDACFWVKHEINNITLPSTFNRLSHLSLKKCGMYIYIYTYMNSNIRCHSLQQLNSRVSRHRNLASGGAPHPSRQAREETPPNVALPLLPMLENSWGSSENPGKTCRKIAN